MHAADSATWYLLPLGPPSRACLPCLPGGLPPARHRVLCCACAVPGGTRRRPSRLQTAPIPPPPPPPLLFAHTTRQHTLINPGRLTPEQQVVVLCDFRSGRVGRPVGVARRRRVGCRRRLPKHAHKAHVPARLWGWGEVGQAGGHTSRSMSQRCTPREEGRGKCSGRKGRCQVAHVLLALRASGTALAKSARKLPFPFPSLPAPALPCPVAHTSQTALENSPALPSLPRPVTWWYGSLKSASSRLACTTCLAPDFLERRYSSSWRGRRWGGGGGPDGGRWVCGRREGLRGCWGRG